MRRPLSALLFCFASALTLLPQCSSSDDSPQPVTDSYAFIVRPEHEAATQSYASYLPEPRPAVVVRDDPAASLAASPPGQLLVALAPDGSCAECYSLGGAAGRYTVQGGGLLGLHYGLSHLLEARGMRFFHPEHTEIGPGGLASGEPAAADMGRVIKPAIEVRGLHLHTLHPIEAHDAFWEGGATNIERARHIIDWIIKNRGNYLQWTSLDDITRDDARAAAWQADTRIIVDYAHQRGVKVGFGIQLFGKSSLQKSLVFLGAPGDEGEDKQEIRDQMNLAFVPLGFDRLSLSFGEFLSVDPQDFINSVNRVQAVLTEVAPKADMAATIHVGNYPKLRVTYQGQELLYYFLVKFADPRIIPWIHTVMYYDLFEKTGGAYLHEEFNEHRDYTLDRLKNNQRVGYHPETAYWVAFDNSVPTYLPLYQRSRHLDLTRLLSDGGRQVDEHVVFSSGWEWGYWQNDYAALRMSHTLPADWTELPTQMFAPWGDAGKQLSQAIAAAAELEHTGLMDQRLAAYLAGRDDLIDIGAKGGTIAAPDRPSFADIAALAPADQQPFEDSVLTPLQTLADGLDQVRVALPAPAQDALEPYAAEVIDGLEATALRARFSRAVFGAALDKARGLSPDANFAAADDAFTKGQVVVQRRHARLHWPEPTRLTQFDTNYTLYQFGYLHYADTLCYWDRERIQSRNLVLGETTKVPGCIFN